jgi:PEGA domain-containing protein
MIWSSPFRLLLEVNMSLRIVRNSTALFVLILSGTAFMYGQSAAEYGVMTGNLGGGAVSGKPLVPFPNITTPANPASAGTAPASGAPAGTPEEAAKANRQYFQTHSGADAAQIAVHTVPDHAQAWIDGRFVGPTPLDMKLAPGHHRLLVRAPNMQESVQDFDLAAKQAQSIDLPLKSSSQNQVIVHWPSQK